MARIAKNIPISMLPADIEAMEIMCRKLDLNKAELVRLLIHRLSTDQVLAEIIKRQWTQERLDKIVSRDKRLTSHNVLYDKQMKIKASWKDRRPTTNGDQDYQKNTTPEMKCIDGKWYTIDQIVEMARDLFKESNQ